MIQKVVTIVGLIMCVSFIPVSFLFFGGVLFGANMEPYGIAFGAWGIYAIGYILGLVVDDVLL